MHVLFETSDHRNVMFRDLGSELMVQANQHLIVDHGEAALLDPGGHKVYSRLFGLVASQVPPSGLKYVLFSHQDPDIVAAANGWLMVTDAEAYISGIWTRFITHFGVDRLVAHRVHPLSDEGTVLRLGETELLVLPAHFLHSPGNFQVYDPVSKILYSGDLGASLTADYPETEDFDGHLEHMRAFHERLMGSGKVLRAWVEMVRNLDIEVLAPQHGAAIRGRENVARFLDWAENLACGVDLIDRFELPTKRDA